MKIQTNFSLKNYNTFGIEAKAKQFVSVETSIAELKEVLKENQQYFYFGWWKQYAFNTRHRKISRSC